MSESFHLTVYENDKPMFAETFSKPVELGRQQDQAEAGPYSPPKRVGDRLRLIVAGKDEPGVSRKHVLVEALPNGKIRVTNKSNLLIVKLADTVELKPNSAPVELPLPASFSLGPRTIQVQAVETQDAGLHSLSDSTRSPGRPVDLSSLHHTMTLASSAMGFEEFLTWLQAAMEVLQSAAGSTGFFQKASQVAVELVGLSSSQVLLLHGDAWDPMAWHNAAGPAGPAPTSPPSQRVLAKVREERKTFWQTRLRPDDLQGSLSGVKVVVASPILDCEGRVIGALYGDRQMDQDTPSGLPITKLEAVLVELLACGVAAGLARVEQERAAMAARVQFEQFFTSELAQLLAANPDMLQGSDAEVTILFCDLRRFSHFTQKLGPAKTGEWIGDVMETLSDCVLQQRGVLVDYIGDELMAMWGAPEKQADHAELACRAALAMREQLAPLNERWQPVLGEPMDLGIGLNTGVARVGNTGSKRKFKYGPLGNTVNLASRVQGATKYLKVKLLATGATRTAGGTVCVARRLGKVRVNNIAEPVDLYELRGGTEPRWALLKTGYERALAEFERGEFGLAVRGLGNLLIEHPGDGPSLVLLSRAVNALVEEPGEFDAVWELPGK
jgi:adenylate cyclase